MAACNTFGGSVQRGGRQLLTLNFEAFGLLKKGKISLKNEIFLTTQVGRSTKNTSTVY